MAQLSERDREILIFERLWWRHQGAKESRIWQTFGLTPARYYQVLNALIDLPEALEFDPSVVRRLRQIRDARPRRRVVRNLGAVAS